MLNYLAKDTSHIYIAIGATDFRKQIRGLVSLVQTQFGEDPFNDSFVFIFCNKKRDSVKVLRYDRNGFVIAQKKLLDKMKFQWPKDSADVKVITNKQLNWLLEGLSIEQKKAHREVKLQRVNACF